MSDTIVEIRMQHPSRNALGEDLIGWLADRFREADGRPVLLAGTKDAFCAGLDLKRVAALRGDDLVAFLRSIDALVRQIFEYPGPTVAALGGHAIAGGCVLALCCDHRVAIDAERVRIGVNEVALGACFPPSVLRLMRYRIPAQHLDRALFGAELHPPRAALELGFVNELAADPESVARDRLARFAAHDPRTYALTKRALREGVLVPSAEDERRFLDEEVPVWASDDVRERVLAALKR